MIFFVKFKIFFPDFFQKISNFPDFPCPSNKFRDFSELPWPSRNPAVSILPDTFKIYERCLLSQLNNFFDTFFSKFQFTFWK